MNAPTNTATSITITATPGQLEGLVNAAIRSTVEGENINPALVDDLLAAITDQLVRYPEDISAAEGSLGWHILSRLEESTAPTPAADLLTLTQDRADLYATLDSMLAAGYILESTRTPGTYTITGKGVVARDAQEPQHAPTVDLTPGTPRRRVLSYLENHRDRFLDPVDVAAAADLVVMDTLVLLDELVEAGYVHRRALNAVTYCITHAGERALRLS